MKVLCLGNNTEDTDKKARELCDTVFHGLLSEIDSDLSTSAYDKTGWYHSSVYDIEYGKLLDLSQQFDRVIMLDQPMEEWSHPDAFYKTVQLIKNLDDRATFLNPSFRDGIDFFEKLVQENKSFCIFPFVELLVNYDHTTVCCRSSKAVTKIQDLNDYRNDRGYQTIREKMLLGEMIPEHCGSCYKLESMGLPSARQQETVEWANRLGITSLDDLSKLSKPVYYEIRASNKCNLQCRMCGPADSHLIDKEYREIGLVNADAPAPNKNITGFEIVDFENLQKLYIAGGEPTVITEFYDFLDRCIKENRTHHEILVNTNGTNLSEKFKSQLKHFSNFQFIFSIDGFGATNHYIRWPSDWDRINDHWQYLGGQDHKITVNTTVSIYNVAELYKLFSYIDQQYPGTLIHVQTTSGKTSPFLYPNKQSVIDDLEKIKTLNCYANDRLFSDSIDGYIKVFKDRHEDPDLSEFFKFNDLLDKSRGVKLEDYIPNLAQYRG